MVDKCSWRIALPGCARAQQIGRSGAYEIMNAEEQPKGEVSFSSSSDLSSVALTGVSHYLVSSRTWHITRDMD